VQQIHFSSSKKNFPHHVIARRRKPTRQSGSRIDLIQEDKKHTLTIVKQDFRATPTMTFSKNKKPCTRFYRHEIAPKPVRALVHFSSSTKTFCTMSLRAKRGNLLHL
jgi:Ulp1 family protease